MRYIVYGAGAIGGVVGGRLFGAGKDVALICRGTHLAACRERGLTLREPDGTRVLRVPVVGHPRELSFGPDDVVILCVKSQDTNAALTDLEAAGGLEVPIVCCQNGVENERLASRRFERVYGMVVALPATHLEAGVVVGFALNYAGVLHLGRYPHGTDEVAEWVGADLTAAGLLARAEPQVMRLKYTKLLANLGNALELVTGVVYGDPATRPIMQKLRQEAVDCYAAAGIEFASDEEYHTEVNGHLGRVAMPREERGGTSTWQSLVKGAERLETDYLNGEIVLIGREHGIQTPYNAALRRLAQHLAFQHLQPGAFSIADVDALVARIGGEAVAR